MLTAFLSLTFVRVVGAVSAPAENERYSEEEYLKTVALDAPSSEITSIDITTTSSPDENAAQNQFLAEQRVDLGNITTQHTPLPPLSKSTDLASWITIEAPDKNPFSCNSCRRTSIKTNLLFDLIGAPNLGVEIPLGMHFSIEADAAYAYWQIKNLYALQTMQGGVELKYRFIPWSMAGWSMGIYGTYCNRYDIQWKDGYQGDGFWSAGVSASYAIPLSTRLNLEFSVAGGYFYTPEVRHYHRPEEGHLMWEETRYNVGRVSLTKIQLNLAWLIGLRRK